MPRRSALSLLSLAALAPLALAAQPHIVMIMTDDQDVELGGSSAEVMPKLHALLGEGGGAVGERMYVHVVSTEYAPSQPTLARV
jgi:hypothetical protein